ncbi:MAG: hypothetical protein JXR96_19065 [Deltaproteobacteria bacterium]|nr:hypothetical protein [Deltaproteobacteria bacterium]
MPTEDKAPRSLTLPRSIIDEIQDHAMRIDRSPSWVAARAWEAAREELSGLAGQGSVGRRLAEIGRADEAGRQEHAMHLPLAVIDEQDKLAAELGSSPSELVHLAWLLGRESISELPSSDP